MKEQLLQAWRIHSKMNDLLIDNTADTGMQATLSTRGGRTVHQQWIHIHDVRLRWLDVCAKELYNKCKSLDKTMPFNRSTLQKALAESSKAIEELLAQSWDGGGKVKGFKKGVIPLLGYFISHESHHRGNILLTLKQSGEKIPDAVKWGLWEWGK